MMQRMGLNMSPIEVENVVLHTRDREISIKKPEVAILEVQGQKIFQIIGGEITEKKNVRDTAVPEEDIQLVAQQAKVSLEKAEVALKQTNGNLAQAILLLSQGQ